MEPGIKRLKEETFELNKRIVEKGLVYLTWGNASIYNSDLGLISIKPSGVDYMQMNWRDMVVLDLNGQQVESKLKPSSDTLTHIEIYNGFVNVNSVIHTHSTWATIWSQAGKSIPCLGTTHADYFNGDIPCVPVLNEESVRDAYEKDSGINIVRFFKEKEINPLQIPSCLLKGHAPFSWGKTPEKALENAIVLEQCAKMAYYSLSLNKDCSLESYILNKHFTRKNGPQAYYGQ